MKIPFWIMEHKEMTLSSRNSVGSGCRRLWGTAASCLSSYFLGTFGTDHIREHSKIDGPFVLPDTAILMFFLSKEKQI